jgi:hypothetical protein
MTAPNLMEKALLLRETFKKVNLELVITIRWHLPSVLLTGGAKRETVFI